ncbi:hypothetical protein DFH09DRAFT_1428276 [Mycena vulgaris]|nr:hypothetical protein DFH09DRAFT_1428276 [Mycena vulgaris]
MHHAGGTRSACSCAEHLERKTAMISPSPSDGTDTGLGGYGAVTSALWAQSFESGTKSESDARTLKSRAGRKFDGQASKSSAGVRFGLIWIRRAGIDSSRLEFGVQEWRCREFGEQHSAAQSTSGKNGRSELDVLLEARRNRGLEQYEGKKPRAAYASLNARMQRVRHAKGRVEWGRGGGFTLKSTIAGTVALHCRKTDLRSSPEARRVDGGDWGQQQECIADSALPAGGREVKVGIYMTKVKRENARRKSVVEN